MAAEEVTNGTPTAPAEAELPSDSGEQRLKELGYNQDLNRSLNWTELVFTAWSCGSTFGAIIPYFSLTFLNGGPVGTVWFWWGGVLLATIMFASLAEVLSSLPTAGSMYFWAAFLAPPKYSRVLAFSTAWMELLASAFGAAANAVGAANYMQVMIYAWSGVLITNAQILGFSLAILVTNGLLLISPVKVTGRIFLTSSILQLLTVVAFAICMPIVAPTLQPASFALGHYEAYLDFTAVPSGGYAVVLSFLMVQTNLMAYDLAGHCSEEAKESDRGAPWAMVMGPLITGVSAWVVLVVLCFCIQGDPLNLFDPTNASGGLNGAFQIMWDCFGQKHLPWLAIMASRVPACL